MAIDISNNAVEAILNRRGRRFQGGMGSPAHPGTPASGHAGIPSDSEMGVEGSQHDGVGREGATEPPAPVVDVPGTGGDNVQASGHSGMPAPRHDGTSAYRHPGIQASARPDSAGRRGSGEARHETSVLIDPTSFDWVCSERIRRCGEPGMKGRRTKNSIAAEALALSMRRLSEGEAPEVVAVPDGGQGLVHMTVSLDHQTWIELMTLADNARRAGTASRCVSASALIRGGIRAMMGEACGAPSSLHQASMQDEDEANR